MIKKKSWSISLINDIFVQNQITDPLLSKVYHRNVLKDAKKPMNILHIFR
jgi:hypothetical protein